jgi:hypothetical protein
MPTSIVWTNVDQINTRVKSGDNCSQHTVKYRNLATITAGEWHKIFI